MAKRIVIDPVTRIEGHAKITIHLDDAGKVADARFHVAEFRGFEKFCEGRPFWEMPGITARICGICPVSHLIASSKAGDAILVGQHPAGGREAPPAHEPGPDRPVTRAVLLPSQRAGPALRHGQRPGAAEHLRSDRRRPRTGPRRASGCGSSARRSSSSGGRKIHAAWSVPGGVPRAPHRGAPRSHPRPRPRGKATPQAALAASRIAGSFREEAETFGNFPSLFMGLVGPDGTGSTTTAASASRTPKAASSPTDSIRRRLPRVHRRVGRSPTPT